MWRHAEHFVLPYGVSHRQPSAALGVLVIYLSHSHPISFTKPSGEPANCGEASTCSLLAPPQRACVREVEVLDGLASGLVAAAVVADGGEGGGVAGHLLHRGQINLGL